MNGRAHVYDCCCSKVMKLLTESSNILQAAIVTHNHVISIPVLRVLNYIYIYIPFVEVDAAVGSDGAWREYGWPRGWGVARWQ